MSNLNNAHMPNAMPAGMHARAATVAHNPGQLRSPAFGNARVPLEQPTLEQLRARAAAANPPTPLPMVVFVPVPVPISPRRFESATRDDPILLSPAKPKMRSLHLTHIDLCE